MSRRLLTFDDLIAVRTANQACTDPTGEYVYFVTTRADRAQNRNESHIHRVPIGGGEVESITHRGPANTDPAVSPDGRLLAFTSSRAGSSQIWLMPLDGGEPRQLTRWPLGARRPVWFPDGTRLLATCTVRTDASDPPTLEKKVQERKERGTAPRIVDELMFRHWDDWTDGQLDHLFSIDVASGDATDLTPGPYPVPPRSLTGDPDYAVSPDGSEICFASLRDDAQAVSTNVNLWAIGPDGGEPRRISPWEGCNAFPVYSPDGGRIAYCGMRRAGYESDRRELLIFDRESGKTREVAPGFDRSVGVPVWTPDGERILFAAEDLGRNRLFAVPAAGGEPQPITADHTDRSPTVTADGSTVVFRRESIDFPPEVVKMPLAGGSVEWLTTLNEESLAGVDMSEVEDFWYEGARGAKVHGMLLRPPTFDAAQRYPVVFLIHGGPQGMFGVDFHPRWNAQMFAARGWVTVMINPRGSTGYGQEFTDAIRGAWGSDCYEDLVKGFDHVLATFPFCDRERTAAAGASFGGFMINWIAGQTDRFTCLVSHDGIFNTEMMNWATDELWFTEWEFGGLPWESSEEYRKFSPHLHVQNIRTPMLIVQGEQDFRCPVSESLPLFTALRRRGIPARLLYLPDEGHWVLKPRNREVWWSTVLDWIEHWFAEKAKG